MQDSLGLLVQAPGTVCSVVHWRLEGKSHHIACKLYYYRHYSRFRNYLYACMVARAVKLRHILPQETNGFLCYKSVNLFSDFTIITQVATNQSWMFQHGFSVPFPTPYEDYEFNRVMLRHAITSKPVRSSAIHRTSRSDNYPIYLLNFIITQVATNKF